MNSSSGMSRATTSPRSIASAFCSFHARADSVSDTTSSALLTDSAGVNSPVPVIAT